MKTHDVVFDIETCADISPQMLRYLRRKLKPNASIKDPAKIEADLAKKEKALIEKAALSPRSGRVCIIGYAYRDSNADGGAWESRVLVDKTGAEDALLSTFDDILADLKVAHIITFNGSVFDVPFLAARAMRWGLPLRYKWPVGKWHPQHIDMFNVLGDGSLEAWMIALFDTEKESSGADIADLVDEGRWDEAADHCLQDVEYLAKIYDRYRAVTQGRGR